MEEWQAVHMAWLVLPLQHVQCWTLFLDSISFPYFRQAHKLLLLDSARIQYHLRWTELNNHLFPDSKESVHFLGNPSLSI